MRLGEAGEPVAGAGEVVLEVHFSALNPADRYFAEKQYPGKPPFPHILGRDGVGRVVAVGEGVRGVKVGDVKGMLRGEAGVNRAGTLAERVSVPAEVLIDVPAGWSEEQAAAAPLVYVTAHQAIRQWADLPEKGVVLVTGASGGVGVAALQLASAMGHVVVGLSRDERKWGALKENGATAVYSPSDSEWKKKLVAEFGKLPVALAVDNIGGKLFNEVLETLAPNGRVSVVGRLAGAVPEFNTAALLFRRLQIRGVLVSSYTNAEAHAAWAEVVALLTKSVRRPLVDRVFGFGEVIEAFKRLEAGPLGKVLVRVRGG